MKRFLYLVVLMALSSSADAGNSFSFVVAGHRVIIEAPRDCNSPSCVSVSIPGIYEARGGRDRDEDATIVRCLRRGGAGETCCSGATAGR